MGIWTNFDRDPTDATRSQYPLQLETPWDRDHQGGSGMGGTDGGDAPSGSGTSAALQAFRYRTRPASNTSADENFTGMPV